MTDDQDFIKKIPLFSGFDDKELQSLVSVSHRKAYPKNRFVIQEGETTADLYVVTCGKAHAITFDHNQQKIVLNSFFRGDYFGEMSFIDGQPRCASVETEEYTEVLIVPRQAFTQILSIHSDGSIQLMKGLLQKLRNATTQINDLMLIVAQNELHNAHLDTIHRLVKAAEYKDENTGNHISRISRYSGLIAEKIGLPDTVIQHIRDAAPMHDIGKIGIPEYILLKPDKLTEKEFGIIKAHTTIGAKILANPKSELLEYAHQIALHHHEKYNGNGYPASLKGINIPIAARIVGLVDAFDVIISRRPYKDPVPVEKALEIIQKDRGTHFDPDVVDIFVQFFDEVLKIKEELDAADHKTLCACEIGE
ncbi:MAG: HD domain-containing phosphohydrolase [Desulfococcaceae bacterium]